MTGFIATPSMSDIEELRRRCERLEARVALLEAKPKSTELAAIDRPKRTRGCRLPEGFVPRDDTIEKMVGELQTTSDSLAVEHRKFCDHFYSVPGQRGVKVDWERAWCNWMREAHSRGHLRTRLRPQGPARRNNDDKINEVLNMDLSGE